MAYNIIRFFFDRPSRIVLRGLTLEEAQAHCTKESTHKVAKDGSVQWFDGYNEVI